ncbi:unnamed protein product [Cylicocyclus nassatus]|uniref:Helitron helicase-like domain-containing protein n=1 Tax=Cylicocyclus nassatus TaxID=53992 RepID=A0AA36H9X8_CYLNA|nr:unnamed protein product [Cylicocyclus nassatus]
MDRSLDRRRYSAPTSNDVAVVYVGEDGDVPAHREFAVRPHVNAVQKISDIFNLADPSATPFFSKGTFWLVPGSEEERSRQSTLLHISTDYFYLLQQRQTATYRLDMIARVYKCKFDALMELLLIQHVLGCVVGYVSVFEWQKRELPHTHSLLILDNDSKPRTAADVDRLISATIPDPAEDPVLHGIITTMMMHRPCGIHNPITVYA